MWLNPYGQDAVELLTELANARPTSIDELVERCRAAGISLDIPIGKNDLAITLELIDRWCEIVDTRDEQQRAKLVNRLLAETTAHPRMSDHDGVWHMHYRPDDLTLGAVLGALASVGTALHLSGRGMHRLDRCSLAECTNVYVDTSRTGKQRYCSTRCSNRDAVRRHRARSVH